MPEAPLHQNESLRLKALRNLNILDSPAEDAYDNIARLAAELCGTPIGVVSLVDKDRQWFKAVFGLQVRETPRCQAFCAHAVHRSTEPLVVSDATKDPRFEDNALVNGAPHIRFYAGVPLVTATDKMPVGTLCVISDQVMSIDDRQLQALSSLATHVETLLHLREANARLAQRDLLIDASHDAIISWTEEEGVLSWNKGAERMYGFRCEDVFGRHPHDILQTSGNWIREATQNLAVGDDCVGELVQQTKSGATITVSTRLQRVTISSGDVFLETSRDITERKAYERSLRRAQTALDTAADAVFWLREETGDIFYANEAACHRYQYSAAELRTMNIADIDPKVRSPEALAAIREEARERKDLVFEAIHVCRDGTRIPVEVASHLIEFENDEFACTFVRDITERVLERQQLEELTVEFQLIFDALPMGVIFADSQRRITRVNPAFEAMFGYAEEDVVGNETKMLYADPEHFVTQGRLRFNAKTKTNHTPYEIDYRRRDGETFTSQTIGTRVAKEDGTFIGNLALIQDISERVLTRKKLEKLNEDRRALVELLGTTDGVWSWQVGTDICDYAPGFRKILGFDGDDLAAFPQTIEAFQERVHPDDNEELWRLRNICLANGTPFVHEFRLRHADDSYIWVRTRADSIRSEDGNATRMAGSIYDISEVKAAEVEREKFFNAGVQYYGVADLETATWTRASDNWKEVLGYEIEELTGKSFLEMAHPDDRELYEARIRLLVSDQPVVRFMGRMRHRDGGYRWIEWNVSPPSPGTSIVYFTASDIADADQDVVRTIADAVPMTLYVYDVQQRTNVFVNRHIVALLGYSQQESIDMGDDFLPQLIHPEDMPRLAKHFEEIDRGDDSQRFSFEYQMKHKDGEYRRIYSTNRTFKRSPDGRLQQVVGTATPLDDLAILRRYATELEGANEELEQFAYIASHDLKQPLRGIDNLARWIVADTGESLPAVAHEHLTKLRGRVARMDRLLDDLLTYSRIGRRSGPVEEVDVDQLIEEVTELLAPPDAFSVKRHGPLPVLTTERIPLEQVFRNLIGNAIKHRERDDGSVMISARPGDTFVEFSVRDDGPGIAKEYHDRVFRMFHTLRPRDEVEASGMGLALAKKQIESRGGTISIESAEGKGAEFRFEWPS